MTVPALVLACGLLVESVGAAAAGGPEWQGYNPDPVPTAPAPPQLTPVSPGQAISRPLFFMYQKQIALGKGQTCPMAPSCSEYGRLAVREKGFVRGVLMTADRIHRCGHDLQHYPLVVQGNRMRSWDPVRQ